MSRRVVPVAAALGAVLALAAIGPLGAEPVAPTSILGHYRVEGSGMIIAIADCGNGQLCGRIAGLGKVPRRGQRNAAQARNAEPQAQEGQLCGAAVLTELHPTTTGWQGRFRDLKFGGDYTLDLWRPKDAVPGDTLLTQRHNAPPFLSRSLPHIETWTRVAPPATACGAATPTS